MIEYIKTIVEIFETHTKLNTPLIFIVIMLAPYIISKPFRKLLVNSMAYLYASDIEVDKKDKLATNYYKQNISIILMLPYVWFMPFFINTLAPLKTVSTTIAIPTAFIAIMFPIIIDYNEIFLVKKNTEFLNIDSIKEEYDSFLDEHGLPDAKSCISNVFEHK